MIAVIYIGEKKFEETSLANHTELFNLIESKYNLKIYDFTKDKREQFGMLEDRFRSKSSNTACPYTTSGGIQVWDFLQACNQTTEDFIIKIRTDMWFTKTSMQVVLNELEYIITGQKDIVFMGLDFAKGYDKIYTETVVDENVKVPDFLIVARRSKLAPSSVILERLNTPLKVKSGNIMYKYIIDSVSRAVAISCQIYLIRKEYEIPNNWQIYSVWVQQYFRLTEALAWVTDNKEIIEEF